MKFSFGSVSLAALFFVTGCGAVPVQYPPGTLPQTTYPASGTQGGTPPAPVAQTYPQSNSRTTEYVLERMAQGAQLGAMLAGPFVGAFGPLGGSFLGLLVGVFTAGAEQERLTAQISSEQQKDKQLEAAIDQELERQRALDNQIASMSLPSDPSEPAVRQIPEPIPSASPTNSPSTQKPQTPTSVAALNKPPAPPTAPTPFKNVDVRDINGDGIADLWIYYSPQKPGEIVRQEEASKADGRVDTWSYFKDGKLVRREVDTSGQGRPDTVYYYDGDKIAREEHDETGAGRMTYRAIYRDGRLAQVQKETTGSGRPDLWVYYDTTKDVEVIIKEERDLDGDGVPDLWSYYQNGRLVRRDVSATGLAVLSKLEQIPAPTPDLRQISAPAN
ncbi:MAG TPA: hypothetical protein VFU31_30320 [Candidatus Binatia bacterium]|nr:hypothetical protein [Candidatus Binatia bacterium]